MSLSFSRELVGDNISKVVADGVEADQLGFDLVWMPDHLVDIRPVFAIFDAWTTLAYVGARTARVRLASGVTDVLRIHPAKTANIVATLDNLTNGRAILGIGAGELMNTEPYGIAWEEKNVRLSRLREAIQVIRMLWSSSPEEPADFEGTFYSLKEAHLDLLPVQRPRPPIYVGAFSSRAMLHLIGELADGWYSGWQTPEVLRENARIIGEGALKAGRPYEEIDVVASVPTFVSNNVSAVSKWRTEVKPALKRELLQNHYFLKSLGSDRCLLPKELNYQFAVPGTAYEAALSKAIENFPLSDEFLEKVIDRVFAFGTPDDCISKIEKYIESGATHILFNNMVSARENYLLIGQEIIPRLKGN